MILDHMKMLIFCSYPITPGIFLHQNQETGRQYPNTCVIFLSSRCECDCICRAANNVFVLKGHDLLRHHLGQTKQIVTWTSPKSEIYSSLKVDFYSSLP